MPAGEYPFEVKPEDLPEPDSDWEADYDFDESDTQAERLAAWRSDKREELLEDLICDSEPCWSHEAFAADAVALDLVQVCGNSELLHRQAGHSQWAAMRSTQMGQTYPHKHAKPPQL